MKHSGCILEFTQQRNDELMRAFRKAVSSCGFIEVSAISEIVVNTPCSRFWVSEERAMVVVSAIDRGINVLDSMRPLKREMFIEIYNRVCVARREHPEKAPFDIVMMVINSPAPKFYMRPRCAMEIIYKIKNGFYNDIEKRNACRVGKRK